LYKSVQGKFLFIPPNTFAVVCIVYPQNALKKQIKENANVSFLRQTIRRALVVRCVIH